MLAPATQAEAHDSDAVEAAYSAALQAFGGRPRHPDQERLVRVLGALSALAVLTLGGAPERPDHRVAAATSSPPASTRSATAAPASRPYPIAQVEA